MFCFARRAQTWSALLAGLLVTSTVHATQLNTPWFSGGDLTAYPVSSTVEADAAVRSVYEANDWRTLWVHGDGSRAAAALSALESASSHGLDTSVYDLPVLRKRRPRLQRETLHLLHELSRLDADITRSVIRFAKDLRPGGEGSEDSLIEAVTEAAREGSLSSALEKLAPQHPQYHALRRALIEHQRIRDRGGWPLIGAGPTLKLGDRGLRVARLRQRLSVDRPTHARPAAGYDLELEYLVREYQQLNGLEPDGRVGPETLRHLDTDVHTRIKQIRINLERWRRMPEMGSDYIHINIPEYRLSLVRRREEQLSMRVVVGDPDSPTPVLTEQLEYLVFNPYWHVPRRIVLQEVLPAFRRDSSYLARNNYQMLSKGEVIDSPALELVDETGRPFPYRVRQAPGPGNALGRVKFMLPNSASIYLHDTPHSGQFARAQRALSHGCVRVERPELLAEALLAARMEWTPSRIAEVVGKGSRLQVNLKRPIPVYITYFSVTADDADRISFFQDIYRRDRA